MCICVSYIDLELEPRNWELLQDYKWLSVELCEMSRPASVLSASWGAQQVNDCYTVIVSNKSKDSICSSHLLVAGPDWPGTARLLPTEMVKLLLWLHWLACLLGLAGSLILSLDPPRELAVGLGILLCGVDLVISHCHVQTELDMSL